jgi:hypothetical protein
MDRALVTNASASPADMVSPFRYRSVNVAARPRFVRMPSGPVAQPLDSSWSSARVMS